MAERAACAAEVGAMQGSVLCAARLCAAAPGSGQILQRVRHRISGAGWRCSGALTRVHAVLEAPAAAADEVWVSVLLALLYTIAALEHLAASEKGSSPYLCRIFTPTSSL